MGTNSRHVNAQVALDLKSQGKVGKVGVSDFCVTGLKKLHEYIHVCHLPLQHDIHGKQYTHQKTI